MVAAVRGVDEYPRIQQALRRARSLAPSDVTTARALAVAEIDRANWVAAVALLVEASIGRPDDPELKLQLGRAQRGLGNAPGAIVSFRSAIDLDPDGGNVSSEATVKVERNSSSPQKSPPRSPTS